MDDYNQMLNKNKFCILTPTYLGHFKFIKTYINSFEKHIRCSVDFVFLIEKDSKTIFEQLIKTYDKPKNNIQIILFDDLLSKNEIQMTCNSLLKEYGKYAYQTLKKYYAMLELPYQKFLILDSESMCIRPTDLEKIFENFFSNPFIAGSEIREDRCGEIKKNVCMCTDYLLGFKSDKWFLENFAWFYDKKILLDLFNELGTPFEIVSKAKAAGDKGLFKPYVFEICLYQNYIYKNNDKYNYRVINTTQLCKDYLGNKKFEDFLKKYYAHYGGEGGLLEFVYNLLSKDNVVDLARLMKENHFNIMRCENASCSPLLQQRFIKIVSPCILAASQNHAWGINRTPFLIIKYQYYPWIKEQIKFLLKKLHIYLLIRRIIYRIQ